MPDSNSCLWYLKNVGFFPQLTEEQMHDLAARSIMETVERKQKIQLSELERGTIYLIKTGRIRTLERIYDDKEVGTDILGPGDIIGITDLITGEGDTEAFEAIEDSLVCILNSETLHDILRENPEVTLHVVRRVGLRFKRIERRLLDLTFCTVPVRLARTLLDLLERFPSSRADTERIDLSLTHQQFADLIGSNREAVTRTFSLFADAGVISLSRKHVQILDHDSLRSLAER